MMYELANSYLMLNGNGEQSQASVMNIRQVQIFYKSRNKQLKQTLSGTRSNIYKVTVTMEGTWIYLIFV